MSLEKFRRNINCAVAFAPFTRSHFRFLIVKYSKMPRLENASLFPGIMLKNSDTSVE
jgi:hypothetical protein